jgi:hypothetical protein
MADQQFAGLIDGGIRAAIADDPRFQFVAGTSETPRADMDIAISGMQ